MKKKVKEEEEGEKDDATRQKLGGKQHCEGGSGKMRRAMHGGTIDMCLRTRIESSMNFRQRQVILTGISLSTDSY